MDDDFDDFWTRLLVTVVLVTMVFLQIEALHRMEGLEDEIEDVCSGGGAGGS